MNTNLDFQIFRCFFLENVICFLLYFGGRKHRISWFFQDLELMLCQNKAKQSFWYISSTCESIWGRLSQYCSNRKSIIFPMSFFWSFIIINSLVSVQTMRNQTFHLDRDLSRKLMYQEQLYRAHLKLGILSYDQTWHAFSWICRAFERLTLAPLSPNISL